MKNDERIDRALDGSLDSEEWERLQSDVINDAELRREYVEQAWLHGQLRAERNKLAALIEKVEPLAVRSTWYSKPVAWAAAAAIVTALVVFFFHPSNDSEFVAKIVEADGCRWAGSELPTVEGASIGAGRLVLVEGMATLEFESGARVTLEAPSTLDVLSKMRCRLIEGSIVADVPESAHGFTVDAPDMEVVDLGTRFGVAASRYGDSHVIVFEGEVEVESAKEEKRLLTTGNTMHVGSSNPLPVDQEIAWAPQVDIEPAGWTSIPSSFGRGKDAFVRRGDPNGPTGNHPLIMVKHTDLNAGNERRAYVTFDLSSVNVGQVEMAELVLDVEPSGLGFSSLVPDSTFEVYGVADGELDQWSEAELLWDQSPAATDAGLITEQTVELGSFEMRRARTPAKIVVPSQALAEFIQGDSNGLVTLAIVRVTGEHETQGLVHAFAAKEHPTAQPPTLRLKISERP